MRSLALAVVVALHVAGASGAAPQQARRISGKVAPAPEGTRGASLPGFKEALAARGDWVRLSGRAGSVSSDPVAPIGADGSFQFEGVSPGVYQLIILPEVSIPPLEVVVSDHDLTGLWLGLPRFKVAGTVMLDEGARPGFKVVFTDITESRSGETIVEAGSGFQSQLPAGDYRVSFSRLPTGYSVVGVMAGSVNLQTAALRVTDAGAPVITIRLAVSQPAPGTRVRGRVEGAGARRVKSVTMAGPAMADTLTATVQADGTFEFPLVLPGRYEARTVPSSVSIARTIDVGIANPVNITIAPPNSRDFAGEFARIEPGEFLMGCSAGDTGCLANELPAHRVAITRPYEIGKYEITQAQWEAVMGFNPSQFKNPAHPVENINRWEDTQEFIARLNAFNDGYRYRLPTEAEWEYAARAGTTSMFIGNPDDAGWYAQNSNRQTHPVGQKQPNAWGLYDMLGNVSEWVSDWYDPVYYAVSPALDPAGPATGSLHSLRGGSAALMPVELRVSYRGNRPYIGNASYIYGFRIVRESAP